jgi:hypothetical protein
MKSGVVKKSERRIEMELIKFILWLIAGAVIGWFASRIVTTEAGWTHKQVPAEVSRSDES